MNDDVISQLGAVRETGATNMLNKSGVRNVAEQCDFQELIEFLDDASNADYMDALEEMGEQV